MDASYLDTNHTSLCFASNTIDLEHLTSEFGLMPTMNFKQGEKYASYAGERFRPINNWILRSHDYVKSNDLVSHIEWFMDLVVRHNTILRRYLDDPEVIIVIDLNCACLNYYGGFSLTPEQASIFASSSNRIDIRFFGIPAENA
jgi:Domain of unknown function (DUF4279)